MIVREAGCCGWDSRGPAERRVGVCGRKCEVGEEMGTRGVRGFLRLYGRVGAAAGTAAVRPNAAGSGGWGVCLRALDGGLR